MINEKKTIKILFNKRNIIKVLKVKLIVNHKILKINFYIIFYIISKINN
jgi:hypothetical protein